MGGNKSESPKTLNSQAPSFENIDFSCVAQNLRRATRLVTRRYEAAFRELDLTTSQFTILRALSSNDSLSHGVLAKILGFDKTTLTRLLKPMLKRQLLALRVNPEDKRGKLVQLTDEGRSLYETALPRWQDAQDVSLGRLSEAEWLLMKQCLRRLC